MARVRVPGPLRRHVGDAPRVEVAGRTVREVLDALVKDHPGLQPHLFDGKGAVQPFVHVFVRGAPATDLAAPVGNDDEILILPSVAGGASGPAPTALTADEIRLYGRHLILPQVGMEGQRRLKRGSVLVIGAGGLGCPALQYLAAAGVGRIGIVDPDEVDPTNLHRQILYRWEDRGKPKVEAAKDRLRAINPFVQIDAHRTRLTRENALELLRGYDVVIDGTDNFPTRYLVNDAATILGKPNVHASIFRFDGQASVFWPGQGPCYRCLFPAPPPPGLVPNCAEGGVLGVLPGVLGVIQATEAIKILLGRGETLVGRLLLYDALNTTFETVPIQRRRGCQCEHPQKVELIEYDAFCGIEPEPDVEAMLPEEVSPKLAGGRAYLLDVREPHEWEIARIDGATLIPLGQLAERASELPQDKDIYVHCQVGARSARAVFLLKTLGFRRVWNVTGGIDLWAQTVDPTIPRY